MDDMLFSVIHLKCIANQVYDSSAWFLIQPKLVLACAQCAQLKEKTAFLNDKKKKSLPYQNHKLLSGANMNAAEWPTSSMIIHMKRISFTHHLFQ